MSAQIELSGEIEVIVYPSGSAIRTYVPFFDGVTVGDRLCLVFAADGANAPYGLKIFSPSGAVILETMVRELPTGAPQSAAALEFMISAKGVYKVEIKEMRGRQHGEAKVRVS
jgi:hypothetical protein